MTRYIDADALNLEYEVDMADDWKTAHEMANIVKYAPTVDAVPVIRCEDCVYFTPEKSGEHWNICRFYDAPKTADGYCNEAEPKENHENI